MGQKTRTFILSSALAITMLLPACAWQRIPQAPSLEPAGPLPLTLAVQLSPSTTSAYYGPRVVELLSEMSVVEELIYPYRPEDDVDALLGIAIDGTWRGSGAAAGFAIGFTFGLLGPFIGPSMTGRHDVRTTLRDDASQLASHSSRVVSKVSWGISGDTDEVSARADDLQARKLAVEIAQWLRANRGKILAEVR